jgi:uncharacterized membrane protein YesL
LGIFSSNRKEGPGVRKNEAQKKGFFRFTELYFRKFWDLCKVNLLFVACMVPLLGLSYLGLKYFPQNINGLALLIPPALCGPLVAGMTYVVRNFVTERHAFLFSDFLEQAKKNLAQSLAVSLLDTVAGYLLFLAIRVYLTRMQYESLVFALPFALAMVLALIFLFMNYYVFLMIVTVDLPLTGILKNALLFCVLGIAKNLFITVWGGVLLFACLWYFPLTLFFIVPIGFTTFTMITCFNAYPIMDKYIVTPYYQRQKEEHPELFDDEPVFHDELIEEQPHSELMDTWNSRKPQDK